MRLKDYITKTNMSRSGFGRLIGVDRTLVHKWVHGQAIPSPHYMAEIYRLCQGEVTPNDFYRLPAIRPRRRITPIVSVDDDLPLPRTGTR